MFFRYQLSHIYDNTFIVATFGGERKSSFLRRQQRLPTMPKQAKVK